MTIDKFYRLETEFKTKGEACSYLWNHNFDLNEFIANNWYNELTRVDAHVCQVRDDKNGTTILITYYAKHIERMKVVDKRQKERAKPPRNFEPPRLVRGGEPIRGSFGGSFGGITV